MKKHIYLILLIANSFSINIYAQYITTINIPRTYINSDQTTTTKGPKNMAKTGTDSLRVDINGAGIANISSINAATGAIGFNIYDLNNRFVINIGYNISGTNILQNNQGTSSYLFFPDLSKSSGAINIQYFPSGQKGCDTEASNMLGIDFTADYNGQSISKTDSTTFSISTYNIALGLEYDHLEIGKTNRIKFILGGNLNIIGLNSDSLTNKNAELLGLKNNDVIRKGFIIGSNWYAMATINQQTTVFIRLYNSWGTPGFNKQFGAILFSAGVTVSANVLHIL